MCFSTEFPARPPPSAPSSVIAVRPLPRAELVADHTARHRAADRADPGSLAFLTHRRDGFNRAARRAIRRPLRVGRLRRGDRLRRCLLCLLLLLLRCGLLLRGAVQPAARLAAERLAVGRLLLVPLAALPAVARRLGALGAAESTTGCGVTCAACVCAFCATLLDAFGNTPVIAAVAARLATITAPAAVAMSGCRRREIRRRAWWGWCFRIIHFDLRFEAESLGD